MLQGLASGEDTGETTQYLGVVWGADTWSMFYFVPCNFAGQTEG